MAGRLWDVREVCQLRSSSGCQQEDGVGRSSPLGFSEGDLAWNDTLPPYWPPTWWATAS